MSFILEYANDAIAVTIVLCLLGGYHYYLRSLARRNPAAVLSSVAAMARADWVATIMEGQGNGVLAIQTLRKSFMAATFLASTSILLIVGVLTLSTQAPSLKTAWHHLNMVGALSPQLWLIKVLALLLTLFSAFFSFSNAIRIFNHVGYMINARAGPDHRRFTPAQVATELNRGGRYYSLGTRAFYYLVPLVFWLFGPTYMVGSTVLLVLVMLPQIDKTPRKMRSG
ncbi:MAG: DUF599 domain-containing protein [Lysobacterales bacterium]|jgi:uncharacterized membrane protein